MKSKINQSNIPQHVAIIMDGNGRWAKNQGQARINGHRMGAESVRKIVEESSKLGIKYLTLYAFSSENWNRPQEEVNAIMALFVEFVKLEMNNLIKNNVRLMLIGNISQLPAETLNSFNQCIDETSSCTGLNLVLAVSYSSRWEIVEAAKQIATDVRNNIIKENEITEKLFSSYLTTKNIPDPDLLIRTGGEYRISNFLMWQSAYTELYFTDVYWPDFREENLHKAILDFQSRERRFGMTGEQILDKNKH